MQCKAHDLDNLYVVDGSFMPSVGAVNPTLTIVANALRVGDHIVERIGTTAAGSHRPGALLDHPMRGLSRCQESKITPCSETSTRPLW